MNSLRKTKNQTAKTPVFFMPSVAQNLCVTNNSKTTYHRGTEKSLESNSKTLCVLRALGGSKSFDLNNLKTIHHRGTEKSN